MPKRKGLKRGSRLPAFLQEARREALKEIRLQKAEQFSRLSASWPRRSPKRGDFDFRPIYSELRKYITKKDLPKLKNPNAAGKKTKKKLLAQFEEVAIRKNAGFVHYNIRGTKQREKFRRIFDPGEPEYFKGGWVLGSKVQGGNADLRFDVEGNPIFGFKQDGETALETDYIEIDAGKFLADPEKYMKSLKLDKNKVYYPAFGRPGAFAVGNKGAGIKTPTTITDLLLAIESDSDSAVSKGRLTAITSTNPF